MPAAATGFSALLTGVGLLFVLGRWGTWQRTQRETFIRAYAWPPGLMECFADKHPGRSAADRAQVEQALRQFFLVHLRSDCGYVSMSSRVVDDLWHEFILCTREYRDFCSRAFGKCLHHLPSAALSPVRKPSNIGLRRTWSWACHDEGINPRRPDRLPLLFAIDAKLAIPKGCFYLPDCATRQHGSETVHCGADFSSRHVDGSIAGFGPVRKKGDGCGGGCCGDGCGGGCGGD
ncbi:glycine-rich domain-containing protein [Ralstonia nicotianae]